MPAVFWATEDMTRIVFGNTSDLLVLCSRARCAICYRSKTCFVLMCAMQ